MPVTELDHYFVRANDLERTEDNADLYYLGTPKHAATDHAGVVDHIAFVASEPGAFVRRFKEHGIKDVTDWGGEDYSKMAQAAGTRT